MQSHLYQFACYERSTMAALRRHRPNMHGHHVGASSSPEGSRLKRVPRDGYDAENDRLNFAFHYPTSR